MQKKQCQSSTDQELLDRILGQQAGWRDMLSELLKRNLGALQARCHAYLRNREDAEDAAQETQLRAYRAIRTFRGESGFRTWLFAIADRQCHNLVCRRRRHLLDGHVRALIEFHEATLTRAGASTDQRDAVRHILEQLPEEVRDVLMLRFLPGSLAGGDGRYAATRPERHEDAPVPRAGAVFSAVSAGNAGLSPLMPALPRQAAHTRPSNPGQPLAQRIPTWRDFSTAAPVNDCNWTGTLAGITNCHGTATRWPVASRCRCSAHARFRLQAEDFALRLQCKGDCLAGAGRDCYRRPVHGYPSGLHQCTSSRAAAPATRSATLTALGTRQNRVRGMYGSGA